MAPYCATPAGLRLDLVDTDGVTVTKTLDLMAEENGVRVSSLDVAYPTVREVTAANPTDNGEFDYTSLFGPRVVTVAGTVVPSAFGSRQAMLAELSSWCAPWLRPHLVYCIDPTEATLWLTVRGSQFTAPVSDRTVTAFTVSWVAADPMAQTLSATTLELAPGQTATARNDGNFPAWPTITLRGPCTDPEVAGVAFSGLALGSAEHVVISPRNRTVYLMGDPRRPRYGLVDFARTRWRPLRPGDNEVSSSAPATVEWRHTYI